jgi:hypothetical protein
MANTSIVVPQVNNETIEPPGSVPIHLKARASGWSEPGNLSTSIDLGKIQAAIRAAERGDTLQLFTLYRDIIAGSLHIQAEFGKRKMVVMGQPEALFPAGGKSATAADKEACEACKWMIDNCENWNEGLMHLLNASLYPVAVAENIFEPVSGEKYRFKLKSLERVPYEVLSYKLPYLGIRGGLNQPMRTIGLNGYPIYPGPGAIPLNPGGTVDTEWNPDKWEPNLRFYRIFDNGIIDYSWANIYAADPARHVVHRGNFLAGSMRDNFGGPMRAVTFCWLLSILGRDWWGRFMDRYGSPWAIAYVDAQQSDTIAFLQQAFQEATKIGALMVDKRAKVDLQQVQVAGAAEGYEKFIQFFHDQISLIIVGQTLSSGTKNTGLGSGQAEFHAEVRDDLRQFDQKMLGDTLQRTVFRRFLQFNGLTGRPPRIVWGGASETDQKASAKVLSDLFLSGIEPTDDAIDSTLTERFGFGVQRRDLALMQQPSAAGKASKESSNGDQPNSDMR